MHPDALFVVPALPRRSRRLLEEVDLGQATARYRARYAAHALAMGNGAVAMQMLDSVHPSELPADERGDAAYVAARLDVSVGGQAPARIDGDRGPYQLHALKAISATLASDADRARHHWQAASEVPGDGAQSVELRFEASLMVGRWMPASRTEEALTWLARAQQIAQDEGCLHDAASVLPARLDAAMLKGDHNVILAIASDAAKLPQDAVGGLPHSVIARLQAARQAEAGDVAAALRTIESALAAAQRQGNHLATCSLAMTKASLASDLGEPYVAWRTLKTVGALLRRAGQTEYDAWMTPSLNRLEQTHADALNAWTERLVAELS